MSLTQSQLFISRFPYISHLFPTPGTYAQDYLYKELPQKSHSFTTLSTNSLSPRISPIARAKAFAPDPISRDTFQSVPEAFMVNGTCTRTVSVSRIHGTLFPGFSSMMISAVSIRISLMASYRSRTHGRGSPNLSTSSTVPLSPGLKCLCTFMCFSIMSSESLNCSSRYISYSLFD